MAPSVSYSSRPGFSYTAVFTCTIRETAGVGAAANYVRAQFTNSAGAEIERQEISSADLIAQLGTNRVGPGTTFTGNFRFDFNSGSNNMGGVLTFNFTDDRLNVLSATFSFSW